MRIIKLYLSCSVIFLALLFVTPEKADARVSVYLGYGGAHIYIGPRYRRYRRYRTYRRYYRVRRYYARPYYSRHRYYRRKRIRRYRYPRYRYRRW